VGNGGGWKGTTNSSNTKLWHFTPAAGKKKGCSGQEEALVARNATRPFRSVVGNSDSIQSNPAGCNARAEDDY
jgi:hypothetical protein